METTEPMKITVIRHAQSQYNVAQMVAKCSQGEVLSRDEDLNVKFSQDLVDCGISDVGEEQCRKARELMYHKKVAVVFTSPLRRCLMTTRLIFENHPSKPKVIVVPSSKELLSSTCDLAAPLKDVKAEYPEYDWSLFDSYESPDLWLLYEISENEHIRKLMEEIKSKVPDLKTDVQPTANLIIGEYLRKLFPAEVEGQERINERMLRFKDWIKSKLKGMTLDGEAVVVSHSRFLEALSAKSFGEKGKPIGATWYKNAEIAELTI